MCKAKIGMPQRVCMRVDCQVSSTVCDTTEGVSSTGSDAQVLIIKVMILELNAGREAPSVRCSHRSFPQEI